MPADTPSDFRPTADWPTLRLRARLLRQTRQFFDSRGFLEVETPLLSADVVVDRHLDPFATRLDDPHGAPGTGRQLFLQTSPEFAMKRLLAAGGTAIYQVTHAFRLGESGPRHNPEFTLVEWYRTGDDYQAGMRLLSELCATLLGTPPAQPITYRDAFRQYAGVDPFDADEAELCAAALRANLPVPSTWHLPGGADRDTWLDLLLVECVEPQLGRDAPSLLHDYPPAQAALARVRDETPPVAERFELYVGGVELANGYHELLDAQVLRERSRQNNLMRRAAGKPALPETNRLLEAMEYGLPACCGCALGFDRLVMLAAGASHIREVISFPIDRA